MEDRAAAARVVLVGASAALDEARRALADAGMALRAVLDGDAALAVLRDGSVTDLVLTDRRLPDMDATALCASVRAQQGLAHVGLVVLAGDDVDGVSGEALAAGADDCVLVPFAADALLARVCSVLRLAQLGESEARLRALMAIVPGAVYRCAVDPQWTMEVISEEVEAITGYPPSDFVANACRSFASVIHPDDRARVEQAVHAATREARPFSVEYRIERADGTVGWVLERGELVRGRGGRQWLDGAIFDLTSRKRTEEELRANRARQAADEERSRIARELHDSVSQALFSMTLHARAAEIALQQVEEPSVDSAVRNVTQLRELTQAALAEMRALIFELRPDALRDEGLIEALRRHADAFAAREGIVITVESDQSRWALDADSEEQLYRLVQEALHNVVQHAAATTVTVSVRRGDLGDVLVIEVVDDGCGFDPTVARPGHLGLTTMRERAHRAGGHLELASSPGDGTTVRAGVPLTGERADA